MCRHLSAELAAVVRFAAITGWRVPSEVLTLQWHQVDLRAGVITIPPGQTKGGEGRTFPMTAALRALLEERQRITRTVAGIVPYVFFRLVAQERGGVKVPKPITSFAKAWAVACRQAGCPGRLVHDLRRTAVRDMIRAQIPERVAQSLTGHRTRSIFERYNIVGGADLTTAARMLDMHAGKNDHDRRTGTA